MYLAKELHLSMDKVLEMSTLEFTMWAAFFQMEGKRMNKVNNDGSSRRNFSKNKR